MRRLKGWIKTITFYEILVGMKATMNRNKKNAAWVSAIGWFAAKVAFFLFLFFWLRATLPRLRYDQLMRFGWKVLLPIALANIVITSILVYAFPR